MVGICAGTFSHAVAAQQHAIPFFIAAPTTTLDASLQTGADIEIEQRPAEEITHFKGQRVVVEGIHVSRHRTGLQQQSASSSTGQTSPLYSCVAWTAKECSLRMSLRDVQVWNPCFDVTPGSLIEGIITEEGVVPKDPATGAHRVSEFMAQRQQASTDAAGGNHQAEQTCTAYTCTNRHPSCSWLAAWNGLHDLPLRCRHRRCVKQ
jgi:hypothetical protein